MNYFNPKEQLLSSGIQFVADKLLNQGKFKKPSIIDIYTGGGITGEGTGEKTTKGPTTLTGIAKQGILSILARSILGPILGPIALTLGTNFFNKKKQGLGFFEQPGDQSTAPTDPRGTFTAEGMQFENIQDALGSTDPNKDINYNTGVITDKTTGEEIGNVYDEVALIKDPPAYDFDDSMSDSGGGATTTTSVSDYSPTMQDPDPANGSNDTTTTTSDAPAYDFARGGLASLYR